MIPFLALYLPSVKHFPEGSNREDACAGSLYRQGAREAPAVRLPPGHRRRSPGEIQEGTGEDPQEQRPRRRQEQRGAQG